MANKTFNLLDSLAWITAGEPVSGDIQNANAIVEGVANRVPRQLHGLFQSILPMLNVDVGNMRVRYIEEQEKLDLRYNSIVILPKAGGGSYSQFTLDNVNLSDVSASYLTNQSGIDISIFGPDSLRSDNSLEFSSFTLKSGSSVKLIPYRDSGSVMRIKAEQADNFINAPYTNEWTSNHLPPPHSINKGITIWHTKNLSQLPISSIDIEVNGDSSGILLGISTGLTGKQDKAFAAALIGISRTGIISIRTSTNRSVPVKDLDTDGDTVLNDESIRLNSYQSQASQVFWNPRYQIKPTYKASNTKEGTVTIYNGRNKDSNAVIGYAMYEALLNNLKSLTSTVEDSRYSNRSTLDVNSKVSTIDPNTVKETLVLTTHRNCPEDNKAFWVRTEFNDNKRLRWQTATHADPSNRGANTIVYARTATGAEDSNTFWTPWTQINAVNPVDANANNNFTGDNTFASLKVKGKLSESGSLLQEHSKSAPLYVTYEQDQLPSSTSSAALPITKLKIKDTTFTSGMVVAGTDNSIQYGYNNLSTPSGHKLWRYYANGDFKAPHGDIINKDNEKLSEALLYRGSTDKLSDPSELKSGFYMMNNDKLRTQFIKEAEEYNVTLSSAIDYTVLHTATGLQDTSIIIGDTLNVYVRINDSGLGRGNSPSDKQWSQIITSSNLATSSKVGVVKIASSWKQSEEAVVPVSMLRGLIQRTIISGTDGDYDENSKGVRDLSTLEPWGRSAVSSVSNVQNIGSLVHPTAYHFGAILKLGVNSETNVKFYIPHSSLKRNVTPNGVGSTIWPCFYLRTSYQKTANDRGNDSTCKSDWWKFLTSDAFVGIPLPWPLAQVPEGFLALNGAAFDKNRYPRLAFIYPSGRLPDLRGEFIRGWDNGRGVDAGRGLLSWQKGTLQVSDAKDSSTVHGLGMTRWMSTTLDNTNAFGADILNTAADYPNAHHVWAGGNIGRSNIESVGHANGHIAGQTRPRNVAFQYICLAS